MCRRARAREEQFRAVGVPGGLQIEWDASWVQLSRPNLTHFLFLFCECDSAFHLPLDLFTCTRSFNSAALFKTLSRFSNRSRRRVLQKEQQRKAQFHLSLAQIAAAFFAGAESFSRAAAACSYFLCVRVAHWMGHSFYKMWCVSKRAALAHLHPSTRINCLTNEAASSYLGWIQLWK